MRWPWKTEPGPVAEQPQMPDAEMIPDAFIGRVWWSCGACGSVQQTSVDDIRLLTSVATEKTWMQAFCSECGDLSGKDNVCVDTVDLLIRNGAEWVLVT